MKEENIQLKKENDELKEEVVFLRAQLRKYQLQEEEDINGDSIVSFPYAPSKKRSCHDTENYNYQLYDVIQMISNYLSTIDIKGEFILVKITVSLFSKCLFLFPRPMMDQNISFLDCIALKLNTTKNEIIQLIKLSLTTNMSDIERIMIQNINNETIDSYLINYVINNSIQLFNNHELVFINYDETSFHSIHCNVRNDYNFEKRKCIPILQYQYNNKFHYRLLDAVPRVDDVA